MRCPHQWRVDRQQGKVIVLACRKCGKESKAVSNMTDREYMRWMEAYAR